LSPVTDKDKGWKRIQRELRILNRRSLFIGYPKGKTTQFNINKAFWNEYGTSRIPSRPFNRTTFDRFQSKVIKYQKTLMRQVYRGKINARIAFTNLGNRYVGYIRRTIKAGPWTPNAPATIARKGRDEPLIDTREMYRTTKFDVRRK